MGITSRRQAEKWIEDGRVSVNGKVLREQGYKLDLENDQVTVDGKLVAVKEPPKVYWLFNKPDMYLTAAKAENDKSVFLTYRRLESSLLESLQLVV